MPTRLQQLSMSPYPVLCPAHHPPVHRHFPSRQLAEREVARLRQESSVAKRAAEEARAQLSAEVERARSAVRAEQDQAVLMQKLEQFNLLRESNATLRWVVGGYCERQWRGCSWICMID